ncbi:MAG: dipeptide ABC transporter ATP-binding protein [Acetobacteraceae bacterium]
MSAERDTREAAPDPALAVEGLCVGYRRGARTLAVICDLSFAVARGESYGLVGESGCGKTTVAMAVMRYLPPNAVIGAGCIRFAGHDLLRANAAELQALRGNRMAIVYQDPGSALNPALTVGRQIAEVYRVHRGLKRQAALSAAAEMLELVQISDPGRVLRRYAFELSGGQQQRIMFAMALATDPDLLVLDEPTTGLDATVEAEVLDLVEQLRATFGTAILFISHNLGIVTRMCERVGVLYAGRLLEDGPSRLLFTHPSHPYTLGLLNAVPRRDMRKDRSTLEAIPGALPAVGAMVSGCIYAPRCPIVRPHCTVEAPPRVEPAPGRTSLCFHPDEVGRIESASGGLAASTEGNGGADAALLEVADLSKTYGSGTEEIAAVDGVSLGLRRGEVLGLVGESGSGKSTLAKCVVGLIDVSKGLLRLEGKPLSPTTRAHDPALRRKLQMVFQNPDTSLNPSRTVRHILSRAVRQLAGLPAGDEVARRVARLAADVRLSPRHLDLTPASLSGGLKQRVAIARAFAGSPTLVLCDEPTSALDVSVQAAILNLLVALQAREHLSYIFISHDLGVVHYLADRIAVMYLGQIVEIGSADVVFRPPHHPYTEALLSAMPSVDPDRQPVRIRLTGSMPSPASLPPGCRFHTRCPRLLGEICRTEAPPWQEDGAGHVYRCHIRPEDLATKQAVPDVPVHADTKEGSLHAH